VREDILGRRIEVGSLIAYAVRDDNTAKLVVGEVVELPNEFKAKVKLVTSSCNYERRSNGPMFSSATRVHRTIDLTLRRWAVVNG